MLNGISQKPKRIILDTQSILAPLSKVIQSHPILKQEKEQILQLVIDSIAVENNAMSELVSNIIDYITENKTLSVEIQNLIFESLMEFGNKLIKYLVFTKIYQAGFLHYEYHSITSDSIILTTDVFIDAEFQIKIARSEWY